MPLPSAVYTYAIASAPGPDVQLLGIGDRPVRYQQTGALIAVVAADWDLEALEAGGEVALLEAAVAHDRVICELFQLRVLLPLRFGTAFVSAVALEDYLITRQNQLRDRLQQLEGLAEYTFKGRFVPPKFPSSDNLKGKEYLLAKRERYVQQQEQLAQRDRDREELSALLLTPSDLAPQRVEQRVESASEDLRAYLLLAPPQVAALRETLRIWQERHVDWQLDLSPPLPPYHFANLDM